MTFERWLEEVEKALAGINMPLTDWQSRWAFDFRREFSAGATPLGAAVKANKYWWREQNKAINQDCGETPNCWLPRNHRGGCPAL
jgi:hypothetical protein